MIVDNRNATTAIVVGSSINALSIIRSLGRKSIEVIAISANLSDFAAKSKYCRTELCAELYGEILVAKLLEIGRSLKQKGILFCTSDQSVLTVSENEKQLREYYDFVFPNQNTIKTLMSKRLFYSFASNNGFTIPKTFFIHDRKDIEKVGESTTFPCIIKPEYRDSNWDMNVSKVDKVLLINSKDEYSLFFKDFDIAHVPLIVQEWIEGSDEDVYYCLTYINRAHTPLAVFTGKKIRQFPVLTGSTAFAESKWESHVADEAIRLLHTANCVGICSVEFKRSKRDNTFWITEPTVGRTDTQEGSSINSGMDIPYIAYLDACGMNPEPLIHFKEGIKWINEPEDYNSLRDYLKHKRIGLRDIINSYRGKRTYALKAIDDPLPFLSFLNKKLVSGITRPFRNAY